jgi:hypothetical protein
MPPQKKLQGFLELNGTIYLTLCAAIVAAKVFRIIILMVIL